jgi:hypothetical protein
VDNFASLFFAQDALPAPILFVILAVMPLFICTALKGFHVGLGIFQFIVFIVAEIAQWKLTQGANPIYRIGTFLFTYLAVNLSFTVGSWYWNQHNYRFYLAAGIPLALAAALIAFVRASGLPDKSY